MPRFCANLGFLFGEVPFLDRFDAAARAGLLPTLRAQNSSKPKRRTKSRLVQTRRKRR